jgi:membrane protein DedA with SNARE-associated domain
MGEAIQHAMTAHAWEALLLIFLLAWLEYVFPPVPGDSTILFGFFLAGTGTLSFTGVALVALSGSVLGALTAYVVGRRLGRSYFFLKSEWAREELDRVERWFGRFGPRLLAANRFIPGVRGFFLYAAGIGRMEARGVVIYSSLSNALWVALLAWGGTGLGSTWEDVRVVFRRYVWGIAVFLGLYVGFAIVRARRRRRANLTSSSCS